MDIDAFLSQLPTLWDGDPQNADHPRDRRFEPIIEATHGMATENKLALLNLAAKHLDGEMYLEVGAWTGCSIIGAALGNPGRFLTIDNFSLFGGPIDECRANLAKFQAHNVELVNGDAWAVMPTLTEPVGVFFYDGAHTFDDQYRAFQVGRPLLSDEAILVIDDTSIPAVAAANRIYTRHRREFTRVLRYVSPYNTEPRWWNGIEIYAFRRADAHGRATQFVISAGARIEGTTYKLVTWPAKKARRLSAALARRLRSKPTPTED